jgi:hypothetical protein
MIEKSYPSKREKPVHTYMPSTYNFRDESLAKKRGISVAEWQRRDLIVKDLWFKAGLRKGDVCFPSAKKDYEEMGPVTIINVAACYEDMGLDENWPQNDYPMILTVKGMRKGASIFFCTINWCSKKNNYVEVCA